MLAQIYIYYILRSYTLDTYLMRLGKVLLLIDGKSLSKQEQDSQIISTIAERKSDRTQIL